VVESGGLSLKPYEKIGIVISSEYATHEVDLYDIGEWGINHLR
jgi:hypothetical protein